MAEIKKGTKIGPYLIEDVLPGGKGGMARVIRAYQQDTGEIVALKISRADMSDPRFGNALKKEVDILVALQDPGVVRIIPLPLGSRQDPYLARAIELPDRPWFYAMEYLAGGSLADLAPSKTVVPFSVACMIALRVLDALKYIHSRGIAHLDIKPENVLFRREVVSGGVIDPVLIDFGVAASTKNVSPHGGTVWTMAPEQLRRARGELPPETPLSLEKMDTYSLGVVVYRMWTGSYPFDALTSQSVTNAVINSAVRPPTTLNSQLPRQVDMLMVNWLDKDPQRRPPLDEIRSMLAYWSGGVTTFSELPKKNSPSWMFWKH